MARLASQAKMGFYPTPPFSLGRIMEWLEAADADKDIQLLDPCAGDGTALSRLADGLSRYAVTWGIELDIERAITAAALITHLIQGSALRADVSPGSFGLLFLNPPYDQQARRLRAEQAFLRHTVPWLTPGGVLVFIVPERLLADPATAMWIGQRFTDLRVRRLHSADYPRFKQVVLFGVKRPEAVEPVLAELLPPPPWPYLNEAVPDRRYRVPSSPPPAVFQPGELVSEAAIRQDAPALRAELATLLADDRLTGPCNRPLLPLRRGHLVALLTAGVLDGRLTAADGDELVIKGYTARQETVRVDEERRREIVTDSYAVGIRVLNLTKGTMYDIR